MLKDCGQEGDINVKFAEMVGERNQEQDNDNSCQPTGSIRRIRQKSEVYLLAGVRFVRRVKSNPRHLIGQRASIIYLHMLLWFPCFVIAGIVLEAGVQRSAKSPRIHVRHNHGSVRRLAQIQR